MNSRSVHAYRGLQNLSFTYDAVGNITSVNETAGTGLARSVAYGYDSLNRLLTASTTAASSTPYRYQYAYDALGSLTGLSNGGATTTYSYAGTGYANPHAATSIGGVNYSYDKAGNLTNFASTSESWDFKNRLTATYASSSPSTFYTYDHTMTRVTVGDGSATTTYPNMYYNISSATTTRNIMTPTGDLLATVVKTAATTTSEYVHPDWLGGTNIETDHNGVVSKSIDYYPYGSDRINTGTAATQRTYINRERDVTGNLYLQNRYYSSDRGQFLSEDPVFWEVGKTNDGKKILLDPQAANSYSYASDNPINKKDSTGRVGESLLLGSVIAPEFTIPALILGSLATWAVMPQASKLIETIQPPNFAELGFPKGSAGPGDLQPPRGGGPQWQKWLYFGLGTGAASYGVYDGYNQFKGDINNLVKSVFGSWNNSNSGNGNGYVVQGNSTYVRTSGGLAPTSLPATVTDGKGGTYYRNSSGLLSTKPGQ